MGKDARRKKQQQMQVGDGAGYRVRTGAEIDAKYSGRLNAIYDAMEASHLRRGAPSFDARRAEQIADGNITEHADGSETIELDPLMADLMKLRMEIFEFKFGRPIAKDEPIFFDFDADVVKPDFDDDAVDEMISAVRAAATESGVPADRLDQVVEHFMGADELAEYLRRRQ